MEILELIFRNFWTFIGSFLLIGLIGYIPVNFVNCILRHRNIRKHGYPENCDADGEFKSKENE